ncbi:hypothetical protein ACU635_35250 [[Actinomadura] parvosata]|uniref:hypothetical protein n=1 Tax=[Actinomadura] parvosata TaxID=1955412 RepID=UPI00406C7E22
MAKVKQKPESNGGGRGGGEQGRGDDPGVLRRCAVQDADDLWRAVETTVLLSVATNSARSRPLRATRTCRWTRGCGDGLPAEHRRRTIVALDHSLAGAMERARVAEAPWDLISQSAGPVARQDAAKSDGCPRNGLKD